MNILRKLSALAFGLISLAANAQPAPVAPVALAVAWVSKVHVPPDAPGIFICHRLDQRPGIGTASDPFDGSTAEQFDRIMRGFPPYSTITLLAGVYLTTGSPAYNESLGWSVQSGWTLRGQGKHLTTIRRASWPAIAPGTGHGVVEMSMYGHGGATVEDLAIDENWQNLNAGPAHVSFAVSLSGDNNTIRRVRAINGYGHGASLAESFTLHIRNRHDGAEWQRNTNALIEACEVADYRGDYGYAIALLTSEGIVRNNTITNFHGTAAIGLSGGTLFEGNVTIGCRQAMYNDTGLVENSVIRRNQFLDTFGPAIMVWPSMGEARVSNLLIEDNVLQSNGSQHPSLGIGLAASKPGHLFDITIRRNQFLKGAPGPITDTLALAASYVSRLLIESNFVDAGLISRANWDEFPSTEVIVRGNRTKSGGVPIGLENYAN